MPSVIIAAAVATAVPLIVLYVIYTLDLYGSGSFKSVGLCFAWGGFAVLLAFYANNDLYARIGDYDAMVRFVAPIVEELLKAIVLVYLVRRPNFTYFVDGAIYGFAAGVGFAVFENYFYLYINQNDALGVAIGRVLSTNLMHATASATVGIALGLSRFQRFRGRAVFLLGGLVVAILIHTGFNNLTQSDIEGGWLLLYSSAVGFGGTGIIAWTIKRGLAEQKQWIEETLGVADRVTAGEAAVVQRLADAHEILAPLAQIFGEEKANQIYEFLVLQAQLGIKRKTLEKLTDDEKMRQAVEKQMDEIRQKMDDARRAVGAYTMLSLRSIFPENASPVWGRLESVIDERAAQPNRGPSALFASLEKRTAARSSAESETPNQEQSLQV
ncbi:MAG: PrsW family intramembrane metalloprotease [Chloroflexi bacterium]|nr:PrsW family intramembrane metalloprotease [Chloroflexota bacterium]MCI0580292.1 PrsW family intramembrane metalloprotease [Chloroflexota bacterium]MCI0648089.1 PrsW family intramembrane metalloprotease [Chloroflexota bacterium]MCI0730920.1 PrsW family intramembrane metalloprotease [Chloroflexota bacterium]